MKAARELGSERRETVRSLSVVGAGRLRAVIFSTRGPRWLDRWCASWDACPRAGELRQEGISAESI